MKTKLEMAEDTKSVSALLDGLHTDLVEIEVPQQQGVSMDSALWSGKLRTTGFSSNVYRGKQQHGMLFAAEEMKEEKSEEKVRYNCPHQ